MFRKTVPRAIWNWKDHERTVKWSENYWKLLRSRGVPGSLRFAPARSAGAVARVPRRWEVYYVCTHFILRYKPPGFPRWLVYICISYVYCMCVYVFLKVYNGAICCNHGRMSVSLAGSCPAITTINLNFSWNACTMALQPWQSCQEDTSFYEWSSTCNRCSRSGFPWVP